MDSPSTLVSVIIPTHNRQDRLRHTLDALGRQSFSMKAMEVVVVADGCTDGTLGMLERYQAPFQFRYIALAGDGPAAARNAGAGLASGARLIFLDDDIEASPGLVGAYARYPAGEAGPVVIGYLPPVLDNQSGLYAPELRGWWEAMFTRMRSPGHRFAYNDLLSGNFSIPASTFSRLGGFNPDLRCHEDYEFGYRLIQAGARFVFNAEALGYHHEKTDLDRSLARKTEEGLADVQLIELHPELLHALPMLILHRYSLFPSRLLRYFAFTWPTGGDLLAGLAMMALAFFDRLKLRRPWLRILDGLMAYRYWKGVAGTIDSLAELRRRLQPDPADRYEKGNFIELDLSAGLTDAEELLDKIRPVGVRLCYGKRLVGWLPPLVGGEPLRGVHLRPGLASGLAVPFFKALASSGVIEDRALETRLLSLLEDIE